MHSRGQDELYGTGWAGRAQVTRAGRSVSWWLATEQAAAQADAEKWWMNFYSYYEEVKWVKWDVDCASCPAGQDGGLRGG